MAPDSLPSLRDELPAHAVWVRKLARSLVRDEAAAEDLAQEAVLAALRHEAPREGLRPWLVRVTENFARRGWRDAARRKAREEAVARAEALPGADESAARLEIQRRLVEELAGLEPALRQALVRRYFDGWSAARIARASGEPASTVRWRLQRGLAELRARLDRKNGGGGQQWRLALVPLCAGPSPGAALQEALRHLAGRAAIGTGTIQGALTMKATAQILTAVTLVTALGVGVWWSAGRAPAPRGAERDQSPLVVAATPAPAAHPEEPAPGEPTRREVVAPSAHVAPAPRAKPEPDPTPRIVGRCVDALLVPIVGALVTEVGEGEHERSGADGAFSIAVRGRRGHSTLRFDAEGFATRFVELRVPEAGESSLGDVVLQPGGSVRGRVFGPDGAPFAEAEITLTLPDLWGGLEEAEVRGPMQDPALRGVSGPDGRFEIGGVAAGSVRVWAGAPSMRFAVSPPLEVRARRASGEVELRLEEIHGEDRITGTLFSPSGDPVPNAGLSVMERSGGGGSSGSALTDERGRFEIVAKKNHVYDLSAMDPSRRWSDVSADGVLPGTRELELVFEEARWIDVHVTAGGRPLEEYELRCLKADGGDWLGSAPPEPRPDGRSRLRAPTEPFLVVVDARGFALAQKGPFPPESPPPALELELAPEPGVRGRVLAEGKPLAGALVSLHEADPGTRIEHKGYPALLTPRAEDEVTTDADGRFVLRLREPGTFVVQATHEGFSLGETDPLALLPQVGKSDLEISLGHGGTLEGRVLVAPGHDPAGVIVAVNRGDARPRTVRADTEGRFRFEALTAGPWHLSRGTLEVDPKGGGTAFSRAKSPTRIPFNCSVREGEATTMDLDLRDFEPCELRGLLLVNGAPARDWTVAAWPGAAEAVLGTLPSTAVGEGGRFALTIEEPGALRLSFTPPAELGGAGRIDALTEIRPGPNEWSEDFALGRLSGRCLSPVAVDEQSLFYRTAEGVTPSCWLPILPDAEGRYSLSFVPAGRGHVQRFGEEQGRQGWSVLAETEIPAGGERVLDIP